MTMQKLEMREVLAQFSPETPDPKILFALVCVVE
jgi:hypothetical protein